MTAAESVARRYEAANKVLHKEPSAELLAMQSAYVDYCRAYGEKYPDEAHLLPDHWKGRDLPEYRQFIAARVKYDFTRA
jgi:hypothetical protein